MNESINPTASGFTNQPALGSPPSTGPTEKPLGASGVKNAGETNPLPGDTLSKKEITDNQKLTIENFSLNAELPKIPAPRDLANLPTASKETSNVAGTEASSSVSTQESSPSYKVPYIALIANIMNEVLEADSENRFKEANHAIREYENILEMGVASAKVTENIYDLKATSLYIQGAASFAGGVAAGANLVANNVNISKAKDDPTVKPTTDQRVAAQAEFDRVDAPFRQGRAGEGGAPDIPARYGPDDVIPPELKSAEYKQAEANLTRAKSDESQAIFHAITRKNAETSLFKEMFMGVVQGGSQTGQAIVTGIEGQEEAAKQIIDTNRAAAQSMQDAYKKAEDSSASSFNTTSELISRSLSDYYAAMRAGR